jgi:hypothetical protein
MSELFLRRKMKKEIPAWPYQAILMIPGSIVLVIHSQKQNEDQQERLSSLLVQGFIKFGVRTDDKSALVAIADYENQKEEERRKAQQDPRIR